MNLLLLKLLRTYVNKITPGSSGARELLLNTGLCVLVSEPLIDQEIISRLYNQPDKPEEDGNGGEDDTLDEDLSDQFSN